MPASSSDSSPNSIHAVLTQLGEVKGQLNLLAQMIAANHVATHQRIDDLRQSIGQRVDNVEDRVKVLEANERSTAVRVGSIAAGSSAVVAAGIEIARRLVGH